MTNLAVLPAEPVFQWITGVKKPKSEADRSPLFSIKVHECSYISTPSISLQRMIRNKLKFTSKMEEVE